MKRKNILIIFFESAGSSCFGSFLVLLFSGIFIIGGILFSFEWIKTIIASYVSFPNAIVLMIVTALFFLISYISFKKDKKFLPVMTTIAVFMIIFFFVGNRLLGIYSGVRGMESYFLDEFILWLGYVFSCVILGSILSALLCFIAHLFVKDAKGEKASSTELR